MENNFSENCEKITNLLYTFRMKKSDQTGYCALDCEMVETINCQNALARVSVIGTNINHQILLGVL